MIYQGQICVSAHTQPQTLHNCCRCRWQFGVRAFFSFLKTQVKPCVFTHRGNDVAGRSFKMLVLEEGLFRLRWHCSPQPWSWPTEASPNLEPAVFTAVRNWQGVKRRPADLCTCLPFIMCCHWDWDYIGFSWSSFVSWTVECKAQVFSERERGWQCKYSCVSFRR